MSLVTVEVLDKVGILTLNNTQKLNALSSKLVEDIVEALGNFQKEQIHIYLAP